MNKIESDGAKLVFLYISYNSGVTLRDIKQTLHISLLSLYKYLDTLLSKDMIEQQGNKYISQHPNPLP